MGRARELEHVGGVLASRGRGVVLAGAPGVGKTRLGTDCLRLAAARGFACTTVMASRASVGLPLGAVAPLLPPFTDPGAGPADLLKRTAGAIVERGAGRRVALLVDDAHWLDDVSATLIHQLVATDSAFVITTVQSGEPAPDPVVALWKNDMVGRLEVGPLNPDEVERLLHAVLGAGVEGVTLRRLARSCAGNALYLRELVLAGLDSGALSNDGGLWRLTRPLVISPRLAELVQTRLGVLTDAERSALELTAFGEPVDVSFVEAEAGPDSMDTLQRRGLLASSFAGRRLQLRLAHPLYGEVLLSRLPATRVRSIKRSLADWVQRAGVRRREDPLRFATWRLDGGGEVRADLMLAGAQAAHNLWDLPLAERLAVAATEAGGGFGAALMRAHLAWLQGRCEEAEERLAALDPLAPDDLQRTMLAATRMDNLYLGLGRVKDALRVGEAAEASVGDPACRDEITSQRARVLYLSGHTSTAVEAIESLPARVSGRTFVSVCMTGASCLGQVGRLREAFELAQRGYEAHVALPGAPMMLGPYVHLLSSCMLLSYAGRLDEAEELGRRQYAAAVAEESMEAQGLFSAFLARVMLARGRPASAARHAREAASVLRERRSTFFLRVALIPLAQALAHLGDPQEAARVLDEADGLGLPARATFGPELLAARAWGAASAGDLTAARRWLEDAVEMARDNGDRVHEAAALHDLARLGHAPQVAGALARLSKVVEGNLMQVRADHARALAGHDPAGLMAAATAFEAMGACLLAAEATLSAAVALRRAGDARRATTPERRAAALMRRCEGAMTPALAPLESQVLLSARELEVASLAVAGLSNREIAERLCLSVRTVENQLQRVYEKLGVARRAQLAEALRSG